MSKSRSNSPTLNIERPPTSIPPEPVTATTSRRQTHENPPPVHFLPVGERDEESSLRPTLIHSPPSPPQPIASGSRTRRASDSSPTDQPMAKRLRRESPLPRTRARRGSRSSPSTDSQGGMADSEDGSRSLNPEKLPAFTSAPKKKRTRTLTTPHQSAVLHALLAQVSIPPLSASFTAAYPMCSRDSPPRLCGRK